MVIVVQQSNEMQMQILCYAKRMKDKQRDYEERAIHTSYMCYIVRSVCKIVQNIKVRTFDTTDGSRVFSRLTHHLTTK